MTESVLPVLEYLQRQLAGTLAPGQRSAFRYPTAISTLLGFDITAAQRGSASITVQVDPDTHGNQQGTVHGGLLVELADAAIGTAHSTVVGDG